MDKKKLTRIEEMDTSKSDSGYGGSSPLGSPSRDNKNENVLELKATRTQLFEDFENLVIDLEEFGDDKNKISEVISRLKKWSKLSSATFLDIDLAIWENKKKKNANAELVFGSSVLELINTRASLIEGVIEQIFDIYKDSSISHPKKLEEILMSGKTYDDNSNILHIIASQISRAHENSKTFESNQIVKESMLIFKKYSEEYEELSEHEDSFDRRPDQILFSSGVIDQDGEEITNTLMIDCWM